MEPHQEVESASPVSPAYQARPLRGRVLRKLLAASGITVVLAAVGFSLVYGGKVYPGVSVNGVYLGGLDRAAARAAVNKRLEDFKLESIPVQYNNVSLRLLPFKFGLEYDVNQAVDLALEQGRQGDWQQRLWAEVRAIAGKPTNIALYTYDDSQLKPYLDDLGSSINQPVADASFNVSGSSVTVNAGSEGTRLNLGGLILQLKDRLSAMSTEGITAPVGKVSPIVDTAGLESVRAQAAAYLQGDLTLTAAGKTFTVPTSDIAGWLQLSRALPKRFEETHNITDFNPAALPVKLALNEDKIGQYVALVAKSIDRPAVNAQLEIQDGKAVVFKPSSAGQGLDKDAAFTAIKNALSSASSRELALEVKTVKPDVSEDSLNDLGIKELISEGITYFPHSTAARITNVRVGASKFNGVLIKPGQTFSFNSILGEVTAENGYTSQPVILNDHVEDQLGGGLCQVSSTAFRAALNAGFPITARANHSFAVSYYTEPFGVPGVDATIYLPAPDFKFVNDSGSYILIQTILDTVHNTLKFDFYGTKAKSGEIRGPFFVTGSTDATQPSHTVFYRDVKDLSGKVIKTDTFNSYYQASTDFPVVSQFGN